TAGNCFDERGRPASRLGGRFRNHASVPPDRRAATPGFFKHRREQRAHGRRNRRDRRRACAAARPEGPSAGSCTMTSFNLSAWALAHRSVVSYLMLALLVLGVTSYLKL